MSRDQASLSVSAAFYARLAVAAQERGISRSALVERACAQLDPDAEAHQDIPRVRKSALVVFPVSRAIHELLEDHVSRHGGAMGPLLDAAINRMLDAAERVACNVPHCAICTSKAGPFRAMPSGEGYVAVCVRCDTADAGDGYAFGAEAGRGLGEGNRRHAAGGAR